MAVDGRQKKRSVLVLDDDVDVGALLRQALGRDGFEVRLASNGQEGLLACRDHVPTVVLVDLMMPHMDGEQFVRRLRTELGDRTPAIVVVSASTMRENIAQRLHASASVEKPFDIEELRDLLVQLCDTE